MMLLHVASLPGQTAAAALLTRAAPPARQLDAPAGADAGNAAYRPKALLPFMKRLPARRVVRPRAPQSLVSAAVSHSDAEGDWHTGRRCSVG